MRPVTVTAEQPGQTSGAAVAVEVAVSNSGPEAFDVSGLIVNATSGDGRALDSTAAAPAKPLTGSVAPGGKRSGVYVFLLAQGATRDGLVIEVSSDAAAAIARFTP